MTTQTLTLPDFLLARIAEDEASVVDGDCRCGDLKRPDCPDRILAECEAKRRIIDLRRRLEHPRGGLLGPNKADAATAQTLADVFKLMAIPYVDHPDFQQEWRV